VEWNCGPELTPTPPQWWAQKSTEKANSERKALCLPLQMGRNYGNNAIAA
jgi:hypothetical protein